MNCTGYKFTGKERDSETGLDYFGARYYGSSMGRFLSPDEFTGGPVDAFGGDPTPPGPLPYADITNPQSLNKYSYTYNNPLRYTDPDGHCVGPMALVCLAVAAAVAYGIYELVEWGKERQKAESAALQQTFDCSGSNANCAEEDIRAVHDERARTFAEGGLHVIKNVGPPGAPRSVGEAVVTVAIDQAKAKLIDKAAEATRRKAQQERRKREEEARKKAEMERKAEEKKKKANKELEAQL